MPGGARIPLPHTPYHPDRRHFLKHESNLSLWQDIRQNQWTMKYKSLTFIYLTRSIFVSHWSIITDTLFLHQIVFNIWSKITGLSDSLQYMKQNHWTIKYRSLAYIYLMRQFLCPTDQVYQVWCSSVIFFMLLYMYIAPEPLRGQNFDVNRNILKLRSFAFSSIKWLSYIFFLKNCIFFIAQMKNVSPTGKVICKCSRTRR